MSSTPALQRAAMDIMAGRVAAARQDPNAYIELVGQADGGLPVRQGKVHREWQSLMTESERLILFAAVGSGKALSVLEPIPTPVGFVPLGDIKPGDTVFDRYGNQTKVSWTSPVYQNKPVYRLTFSDSESMLACEDHLWVVRQSQSRNKTEYTLSTKQIAQDLKNSKGSCKWLIPVCDPVQYPEQELAVHPYVLGVWLGDGSSHNSNVTCHEDDAEVVDRCIRLENDRCGKRAYKPNTKVFTQCVGGTSDKHDGFNPNRLRLRLRDLGVLDNKHVPEVYLRGSEWQRRELLSGLLDTDGTVGKDSPHVEFCVTNERLARDAWQLARSLGFKASFKVGRATINGRYIGPKYRVCWSSSEQVFKLKRKVDKLVQAKGGMQASGRSIVSCDLVESCPVKCLAVEAESHTFLAGHSYTVTHNSNQLRWRIEWELGRNPDLRIGLVSSSQIGMPSKMLAGIRATIESSRALRYVFPDLRPSTVQRKWGDSAITVSRHDNSLDPSIQIFGAGGKILGSRLDLIIVDDICNHDNTRTEVLRDKMWDFVTGPMLSRFSGKGGRVWFIGNTWHQDDVLHRLERTKDYTVRRYSAFQPDPNDEHDEIPTIPELWTIEKLRQRERSLGARAKPLLRNILLSSDETRIKPEWLAKCLDRGRGVSMPTSWDPSDAPTFTGVDLGVGNDPKRGDLTAIFTIALLPDGTRRVLDLRSGRWTGPKTLEEIGRVHKAYGSIVYVENNGQQGFLHQFASQLSVVPIKAHSTGMNKYDFAFGIESIGIEFSQGKWMIPSNYDGQPLTEELSAWLLECSSYTPNEHAGDRLIASWISREAARKFTPSGIEEDLYDNFDILSR